MISTVEIRKVLTIELERSELYNILYGEEMRGRSDVKDKNDDIQVDLIIYCSNPEENDPKSILAKKTYVKDNEE